MPIPSSDNVREIAAAKEAIATHEANLAAIVARIPEARQNADELKRTWPTRQLQLLLARDPGLAAAEQDMAAAVKLALDLEAARATAESQLQNAKDSLFRLQFADQIVRCGRKTKKLFADWRKMDELQAQTAACWEALWQGTRGVRDSWPGGVERFAHAAHGPLDDGTLLTPEQMQRALMISLWHHSGQPFISSEHVHQGPPSLPGAKPKNHLTTARADNPSLADAADAAEKYIASLLDGTVPPPMPEPTVTEAV